MILILLMETDVASIFFLCAPLTLMLWPFTMQNFFVDLFSQNGIFDPIS